MNVEFDIVTVYGGAERTAAIIDNESYSLRKLVIYGFEDTYEGLDEAVVSDFDIFMKEGE